MSYYNTQYVNIKGDMGVKGSQGSQGGPGYDGHPGPRGEVGPEGPIGPRGFEGPRGLQGIIGNDGPKGQKGDIGGYGPQGTKGNIGQKGQQGPTGPYGPTGMHGNIGLRGEKGVSLNIQWVGNFLRGDNDPIYTTISGNNIKRLYIIDNNLSEKLEKIRNTNNDTIVVLNTNEITVKKFNEYMLKDIVDEEKIFYVGSTNQNILNNDSLSYKIDTSGTNLLDTENENSSKNNLISLSYNSNTDSFIPYLMNKPGNDITNSLTTLENKFNNLIAKLINSHTITVGDKI